MSEFNTHGGYFAPAGYMKVEAGGSHEENPNGGVQIGVDPQGIPNMLEEGEPVYNDYVFSDNIKVSDDMIEKHKLPKQLKGKLYSDAVQYFMDEAEQRPFDATSRNGLEAMLMRLADAQEEQKQLEQDKELDEALSGLSDEEIAAIGDQAIATAMAQDPAMQQQMVSPEERMMMQQAQPMPEEQMMPAQEQIVEQPMMSHGGMLLRRFDDGGDIDKKINEARVARGQAIINAEERARAQQEYNQAARRLGWRRFVNNFWYKGDSAYDRENDRLQTMLRDYANGFDADGAYNPESAIRSQSEYVDKLKQKKDKREEKLKKAQDAVNVAAAKLSQYGGVQVPTTMSSTSSVKSGIEFDDDFIFATGGKINKYDGLQWNQPSWLTRPIPSATVNTDWKPSLSGPLYDFDAGTGQPRSSTSGWRPKDNTLLGARQPNFVPIYSRVNTDDRAGAPYLSTIGEWAGPALSLGQALWDMGRDGDRYPIAKVSDAAPEGRINLVNPRYRAIDVNQTENRNIAQENAVLSAIRNSGAGASIPAAIIAADYRAGVNRGLGFLHDWQANNQNYNNTIAAINNNEATRAQFDYGVDQARKAAMREAQRINIQNDLIRRRLENQSDQDYANAFITSARDVTNFLGARAKEARAYNMANSRRDLYDYAFGNGVSAYRGVPYWQASCGGFLKKIK